MQTEENSAARTEQLITGILGCQWEVAALLHVCGTRLKRSNGREVRRKKETHEREREREREKRGGGQKRATTGMCACMCRSEDATRHHIHRGRYTNQSER